MRLHFTKMQGLGNDYIYFDCIRRPAPSDPERLSITLSDRHFGRGGDGIVMIMPSDHADFRMRMFNADGSEGAMCGNASRCIAKYVYDRGLTDKKTVTLETLSGIKTLDIHTKSGVAESVTVDMGSPEVGVVKGNISTLHGNYTYTFVDMGNPHCVIFTNEPVDSLELEKIGRPLETHELFPYRANIEFVNIIDDKNLRMRVWERGSGETLACGTGACAVVTAAAANGISPVNEDISVHLKGGVLTIRYTGENVLMTGAAEFSFDGEIEV